MRVTVMAEGTWCVDCERFEVPDVASDGTCIACGCGSEVHLDAEVVAS
jgi:hypothetical protein